ncbi:hypothetical protein HW555_004279 [Spodoptera exigua]|uniref:Uncharacterized protein n=1 Tax=Spodoptera exigua TaxID=7107 RepID=A0A835GMC9_SPOEX|nr:hypothetical protein HW555_004279 [Spodoptera exigua]
MFTMEAQFNLLVRRRFLFLVKRKLPIEMNSCTSSGDSDAASTAAVETTLERLRGTRGALEELWSDRERRLELTLQLRHFERDALEVSKH